MRSRRRSDERRSAGRARQRPADDERARGRMSGGWARLPDRARWRRIEQILDRVPELLPAAQPAFLDAACAGYPGLRHDLDALLRPMPGPRLPRAPAAAEVGSWLDEPATEGAERPRPRRAGGIRGRPVPGDRSPRTRRERRGLRGRRDPPGAHRGAQAVHLQGSGSSTSRRRRFRREAGPPPASVIRPSSRSTTSWSRTARTGRRWSASSYGRSRSWSRTPAP